MWTNMLQIKLQYLNPKSDIFIWDSLLLQLWYNIILIKRSTLPALFSLIENIMFLFIRSSQVEVSKKTEKLN